MFSQKINDCSLGYSFDFCKIQTRFMYFLYADNFEAVLINNVNNLDDGTLKFDQLIRGN